MYRTAIETLQAAGHTVETSDLYAMGFDPVSDRRNFTTTKNAEYFKQQVEEQHASEVGGFAAELESEMRKLEEADLLILQFPLWWFSYVRQSLARNAQPPPHGSGVNRRRVPAILKGWFDRVLAIGRFYGGGKVRRRMKP